MSSPGNPATVAVVTGASSGLGAIFAQRLGERGHNLVLADRDRNRLEEVRQRVTTGARDGAVTLVTADLATGDGVLALLRELGDQPVDLLVNNAGFGTYGSRQAATWAHIGHDHAGPGSSCLQICLEVPFHPLVGLSIHLVGYTNFAPYLFD
jgi:short-subunit dehydrogenase